MSQVRVVFVEMEASGDAVSSALNAIRSLMSPTQNIPLSVAPSPSVALLETAAGPPVPEIAPQRKTRRVGKAKRAGAQNAPGTKSGLPDSGVIVSILGVLARGPMTSAQVVAKSGYSDGSVYPALKRLRDEGRIVMVEDPADGLRKNSLKAS